MTLFRDRVDAGRRLGSALLARYPALRTEHPIVLGIPRGGVVVASEVARALGAPLDVIVARKLGAPRHEELGIGAVAPGGTRVLDQDIIASLGVTPEYIEAVTRRERDEVERRMRVFRGSRPLPVLTGRAVLLVDDGLATGVTARAAIAAARHELPSRTIFAAPVCSREGAELLRRDADDVVCAGSPIDFRGVGEWYEDFDQVADAEVLQVLAQAWIST